MKYTRCLTRLLRRGDDLSRGDIARWTDDDKGKLLIALVRAGGGQALARFGRSIELLLNSHPNLNYQEEKEGLTPLMAAIQAGDEGMKRSLMYYHAHPDPRIRLAMDLGLRSHNKSSALGWSIRTGDRELAAALRSLAAAPKKGIRLVSLDFDGSVFHQKYHESPVKNVVLHNQAFLENLKEGSKPYFKTVAMVGSVRQSWDDDRFNGDRDSGAGIIGSCYPALLEISWVLGAVCDPFLLADVYAGRRNGRSFDKAMQALSERASGVPGNIRHDSWIHDSSKITILYAQMHKIALDYPDETIQVDFYDDRYDILGSLQKFFKENPDKMPKNVTLRLHHYDGGFVTPMPAIAGTGVINLNYRTTVQRLGAVGAEHGRSPDRLIEMHRVPVNELKKAFSTCVAYEPIQLVDDPMPATEPASRKRPVFGELPEEPEKRSRNSFFEEQGRSMRDGEELDAPDAGSVPSAGDPSLRSG